LIENYDRKEELFLATKVWTKGQLEGENQIKESFKKMHTSKIQLIQIHNLLDWETHITTLRKMKESGKIDWLKQDLKFIQKKIYDPEAAVSFSKTINNKFLEREKDLVKYFNQLIQQISEKKVINSTLFLSKKSQKELLDLIFKNGLNFALDTLTDWRKDLLTEPLRLRLKDQLS